MPPVADNPPRPADVPVAARANAAWPCGAALAAREAAALRMLQRCRLCEWRCDVDRLGGERGRCLLTAKTRLYKHYLSFNEEPELLPAYRVFLGACSFRCTFCDEAPQAFDPRAGRALVPAELAADLLEAVGRGARSISVLGGEPTLHVHSLLALARAADNRLPLAINTNLYMAPVVLDLLRGVVRWYLADVKFGNDTCARQIAGIPTYSAIVRRNLALAQRGAEVIVRHVLLPGHVECCLRPIVETLSSAWPGLRFQLYPGYVPVGLAACDPQLGRLNTRHDVAAAVALLRDSRLRWQTPPLERPATVAPDDRAAGTARVTIGRDGHIYCHDLSATLLPVLQALAPEDPVLAARALAVRAAQEPADG